MPLLKPPEPEIPTRKFYVRINKPLAAMLDRYSEFLGAEGIDHVVNQALEFVFRKDLHFKEWLAEHPEPTPKTTSSRRRSRQPDTGSVSANDHSQPPETLLTKTQ